jgi:hypothetical protein
MSDKWVMKYLKKYPHINTFDELKEISNGWIYNKSSYWG